MLPVIERVGPRKVGSWDVSGVEDIVWFVCIAVFEWLVVFVYSCSLITIRCLCFIVCCKCFVFELF